MHAQTTHKIKKKKQEAILYNIRDSVLLITRQSVHLILVISHIHSRAHKQHTQ